ncbi:CbtA family protein [Natronomonas sp.]|uniref:CbtA family protein n=1 Tax=Natronomonas sp. TaxID=2184060 RepID=UPI00397480F5
MLSRYFQRGVAAGFVAGLAYATYMLLVGNPLSEYVDGAGHAHEHAGAVSELTTAAVSVGSGLLWTILLGGVLALALYALEPALPGPEAAKPYILAGAGFLTVSGFPWLVLPPAAPGAVHAYPVDVRIRLYVGLVVLGALTVAASVAAYDRGVRRHVGIGLVAGATPLLAVAAALSLVAPTVTTHPDLPAELVATYQGLAVLSQAALWLLIAATFDALGRWASIRTDEPEPTAPSDDALVG